MKFKDLIKVLHCDLYRQLTGKKVTFFRFLGALFLSPGFKYVFWFRLSGYFKQNKIWRHTLYYVIKVIRHAYHLKYGIMIPTETRIGPGLRIDHFGGIFLSKNTIIGKNCSISSGVVMGVIPRGPKKGTPVSIGDNVYIGIGAKILGNITIGNGVVIGANSVVVKDIPDNVTVFGIPARVVANEGSTDYIRILGEDWQGSQTTKHVEEDTEKVPLSLATH